MKKRGVLKEFGAHTKQLLVLVTLMRRFWHSHSFFQVPVAPLINSFFPNRARGTYVSGSLRKITLFFFVIFSTGPVFT